MKLFSCVILAVLLIAVLLNEDVVNGYSMLILLADQSLKSYPISPCTIILFFHIRFETTNIAVFFDTRSIINRSFTFDHHYTFKPAQLSVPQIQQLNMMSSTRG